MPAKRRSSKTSTSTGRFDLEKGPPKPPREEPKGLLRQLRAIGAGKKAAGRKKAPADARDERLDPDSPWALSAARFPTGGTPKERLRHCVRYAVLAPSSHNTQPWKFRVHENRIDVFADRTRALPVADPNDRELTISVGAALGVLRMAVRRFGFPEKTAILPDKDRPDLLATVFTSARAPSSGARGESQTSPAGLDLARVLDAVPLRRTTRAAFEDRPVPATLVGAMRTLASEAGATLSVLADDASRSRLAMLVAEADVIQMNNRSFRRELAMWMHHNRTHHKDGVPGFAMGMKEVESLAAPLVVRLFDVGEGRAARDGELTAHSPLMAVLSTPGDTVRDWINAGQALAAVTCRAAAEGVTASYLNQAVELPQTRAHLAKLCDDGGIPQLVLRFGFGPVTPHTPRRPVEDVLLPSLD